MRKPEAKIFKIIQNFTDTLKKIRFFKAHHLIARSIFDKEAPYRGKKTPTHSLTRPHEEWSIWI